MNILSSRALSRTFASVVVLSACAIAVFSGGCQSAPVKESVISKYPGDDNDSQLNFWHELANRRLTSNDDAFHAVLLDIDGQDKSADYAARVATLKSRGYLQSTFSEPPDVAVERGTIAVIAVKMLEIKGGWVMHVFGPSPRYATKELVYQGIFPPSSPQQTFSGAEFVGVIGKIEDYQKPSSGNAYTQ